MHYRKIIANLFKNLRTLNTVVHKKMLFYALQYFYCKYVHLILRSWGYASFCPGEITSGNARLFQSMFPELQP